VMSFVTVFRTVATLAKEVLPLGISSDNTAAMTN